MHKNLSIERQCEVLTKMSQAYVLVRDTKILVGNDVDTEDELQQIKDAVLSFIARHGMDL